jgi:hypothetical protein
MKPWKKYQFKKLFKVKKTNNKKNRYQIWQEKNPENDET